MSNSVNALLGRAPASPVRQVRPTLEALEDRCVPSAATVDLTTAGASGVVNGAVFQQADPQPTGCGVIHDFVRIQAHGSDATVEQGYNTDARPLQFDEKTSASFTHSIQLSDVPVVVENGVAYREFLLGVNQANSSPLLSLDQLKIFLGGQGNLTGYDSASGTLAGLSPVYDLNAGGGNNWIALNAALSSGNGSGDMFLLVPDQLFTATPGNPYIYLYSQFGDNYAANGGFEQWAVPQAVPPGGVSGVVYNDVNQNGVFGAGDSGLSGVMITLTGVTAGGQTFTLATMTDANGFYQFTGLPAGIYSLTAAPVPNFLAELGDVGSLGGTASLGATDNIYGVPISSSQNGLNYDFGELQMFAGS